MARGRALLVFVGALTCALAVWTWRSAAAPEEPLLVEVEALADIPTGEASDFLYGRVETVRATYEGRLRFGGIQEGFWNDHFDAFKKENPWEGFVDPEVLIEEEPIEVFGRRLGTRERAVSLRRPFRVAFGHIAKLEASMANLQVTLKNGTAWSLDRMGADDFGDGLRVWDAERGVVELDELSIRKIEFLPTPAIDGPQRLYGTVRSPAGAFTGFVQWDREASVASDEVEGRSDDGPRKIRFGDVARVARTETGSLWTLRDGREVHLAGNRSVARGHRGVAVADPRYGRVVLDWSVFESLELSDGGAGPTYSSFVAGRELEGRATLFDGSILEGRLVYDLDESETTDTLDVSRGGVDYVLSFDRVVAIEPRHGDCERQTARVTLRGGEVLELDCSGDLAPSNAGLLVFTDGRADPIYVKWIDLRRLELFTADSSTLDTNPAR